MRSTVKFFALTYVMSWICWIVAVELSGPAQPRFPILREVLILLGTFAPAIAALVLTASANGKAGLAAIASRLLPADVGFEWYVFAILYMPAVKAAVALIYRLGVGGWPPFGHEGPVVIAAAILLSTPVQAGEEMGWRGYALPRIAARLGFRWAAVAVGLVWGVWHLPLFFLPDADKYGQSFPLYVAGVVAFSIANTWLYAHTNGNLFLTMLMHSAFNQTIGIIPDLLRPGEPPVALGASLPFLLTIACMWVAGAWFLARMPHRLPASFPLRRVNDRSQASQ